MEKQTSKVPALRFPEFSGEWETEKVGSLCDFIVPGRNKPVDFDGEIPWITTPDIEHNGSISISKIGLAISEKEAKNVGSKIVPKDSIIINCVGELGLVAIAGRDIVINQQLHAFIPLEKINNKFLLYGLSIRTPYMNRIATKTAVPYMNMTNCNSIPVIFPTLPEQQKIADFLSAVDEKIQQLARKKELLEQYKKGVMQRIFSQELRFKDDDGRDFPEWEEKRAKEIFKNHTNKNHNGDLPLLAATQDKGVVYRDSIDLQIQSSQASIDTYKVVEVGDFVISLRSFQGGIEYSEVMGICSPAYTVLKPKINLHTPFFKFLFKKESFISQLSASVIGIRDGKQISFDAFGGIRLVVPSLKEQEKIADFLSALDEKIHLATTQLDKAKEFKKGLLQKMFV